MIRPLFPTMLLCAVPHLAFAQNWDCTDAGNLPQQGMNYCASVDFVKADDDLNDVWASVFPVLKERDKELDSSLRGLSEETLEAQRYWIKFRDAHCASEGFLFRGGSMEPLIVATCKTTLTRQRIEQLNNLIDEG